MGLPVYFPTITDIDDKDRNAIILYANNYPEVPNTIPPEAFQRTLQRFSNSTWILRSSDALIQEREDPNPVTPCELVKSATGARQE